MLGATPQEILEDPKAPHADQKLLLAPAGTVVVFNSHTWHGGTVNRSSQRRRAMHCYFSRRNQPQQLDQKQYVRPKTRKRLSPAARYILDV
jgi:ectoine hydroxylase-related dioxygenase (phytanoyl-CoA dioxygenase family)